jgi:exoribonuclease R
VIEAALAIGNGREVPDEIAAAFDALPRAMARGEQRANRVERQALELAEAVVLSGREGHTFPAVVIDEGEQGVDFQVTEPAVLGRVSARHVDPGDEIRVRVVSVDVENAQVVYERVA